MKVVITTVGTSLFTNYMQKCNGDRVRNAYERYKNKRYDEMKMSDKRIESVIEELKEFLQKDSQACAEISSLLRIKEELNTTIEIYLLATDTILSALATSILEKYLKKQGYNVKTDIVLGLQVQDRKDFEKRGLVNFIQYIDQVSNSGINPNVVMNITGGYKALIPYATIISQVHEIPLYYLFGEESDEANELILIPQAPLAINWGMFGKYRQALIDLSKGEIYNWDSYKQQNDIRDDFKFCCVWEDSGMAELNAIGKLFYDKFIQFDFTVDMPASSKYFKENDSHNKKQVEKAIKQLYTWLIQLEKPFEYVHDEYYKHAPVLDTTIYKHTNPQIRIQYKWENQQLIIFNYYFVDGGQTDARYSKYIQDEYGALKKLKMLSVPIH